MRAFDHNALVQWPRRRVAFGLGPLISSLVMPALGRHFLKAAGLLLTTVVRPAQQLCQALMDDHIEMLFCAQGRSTRLQHGDRAGWRSRSACSSEKDTRWWRANRFLGGTGALPDAQRAELSSRAGEGRAVGHGGRPCGRGPDSDNYEILQQLCLESDGV